MQANLREVSITGASVGVYAVASLSNGGLYRDHCATNDSTTGIKLTSIDIQGQLNVWLTATTVLDNFLGMDRSGFYIEVASYGNDGSRRLLFDVNVPPNRGRRGALRAMMAA